MEVVRRPTGGRAVLHWREVTYRGESYSWSKHHEWEKFVDLPRRTGRSFELCINVDAAEDRQLLESRGWRLASTILRVQRSAYSKTRKVRHDRS